MAKFSLLAVAAAASAALGAAAHAAPPDKQVRSAAYARCVEAARGVDPKMRACSAAELALEDARLNAAYRDLTALVGRDQDPEYVKGRLDALRKAQRAWIASRDADCEAVAHEADGGTLWFIVLNECHIEATQVRTALLREWLEREREMRGR